MLVRPFVQSTKFDMAWDDHKCTFATEEARSDFYTECRNYWSVLTLTHESAICNGSGSVVFNRPNATQNSTNSARLRSQQNYSEY